VKDLKLFCLLNACIHLTNADIYKQGGCYGVARVRHVCT